MMLVPGALSRGQDMNEGESTGAWNPWQLGVFDVGRPSVLHEELERRHRTPAHATRLIGDERLEHPGGKAALEDDVSPAREEVLVARCDDGPFVPRSSHERDPLT